MLSTLNGAAVSWAEIDCTLDIIGGASVPDVDFKSLDHETAVTRGDQIGAGGKVVKRTTGAPKSSASGSVYRDGLRALKRAIMTVAPADSAGRLQLSKVAFNLIIKHSMPGETEIYTLKLLGCHLDKNAFKHDSGSTDADTVDIDLNPIDIVEIIDGVETVLL